MESQGMKFEYIDIPANLVDKAKKAREHMVSRPRKLPKS